MAEELAGFMVELFGGLSSFKFGKEIIIFIISMMPILELRGGLIAAALLGLKGLVVKTHGSSKAVEIKNTILQNI